MASYDPMLGTRTVVGSGWLTRFLTLREFRHLSSTVRTIAIRAWPATSCGPKCTPI